MTTELRPGMWLRMKAATSSGRAFVANVKVIEVRTDGVLVTHPTKDGEHILVELNALF